MIMQPHGPNSNFLWHPEMIAAGFEDYDVLLAIHAPSTETGQT
jgi:hypothetical protein